MATTKRQKTAQIRKETYLLFDGWPVWQVLVKKDGNERVYIPVFHFPKVSNERLEPVRVESFALQPPPGYGDDALVYVSLTYPPHMGSASETETSGALPDITVDHEIPAQFRIEHARRRIIVTLMCTLEARPGEHRLIVEPHPDIGVEYLQEDVEEERQELAEGHVIETLAAQAASVLDFVGLNTLAARAAGGVEQEVERAIARGLRMLSINAFEGAEEHFRQAVQMDALDETEACFYLALALLWQGKADEAAHYFDLDQQDRGVLLSSFFTLWSDLCAFPGVTAYIADLKERHADHPALYEEEEESDDDLSGGGEHPTETVEGREARTTQSLLSIVEDNLVAEAEESRTSTGGRLLSALLSYLRSDYQRCYNQLTSLRSVPSPGQMWAVTFWRAMAAVALGKQDQARKLLGQLPITTGPTIQMIPPVLLHPLRWTAETHAEFYRTVIEPIFESGSLPRGEERGSGLRADGASGLMQDLEPTHQMGDWLIADGLRLLEDEEYTLARESFFQAMEHDPIDLSPACFWYAVSCLYLRDLDEATEYFRLDTEDRGDAAASLLLHAWGRTCQYPTQEAYAASVRNDLDLEEEEGDVWGALEQLAEDHDEQTETDVYRALIAFLRGDHLGCLALLETAEEQADVERDWMVALWKAMASAALERDGEAQEAIEEALADGMPPVLLLPLQWFKRTRPSYFNRYLKPLFIDYGLPYRGRWGLN